jgi:dipeptidyl aminopeptidase/acylaminoacyl peptidase
MFLALVRAARPLLALAAAVTLAALGIAHPAHAATRAWTQDDILSLKSVSDPQVSPNGEWVAYVVSELSRDSSEYQTDVWLIRAAGGEARRLTGSPAADERPRWSPDGRLIAFLSERERPGAKRDADARDDEGRRQVWLIRPDGGEAWLASNAKGGVSAFEWSRDGRAIAYLSHEPKSDARRTREKEKDDAHTPAEDYVWNRLWIMDVASGKATQLTSGALHVTGFSLSPDGKRAVFAAQPTPLIPDAYESDLYLVSTSGGPPQPLVRQLGGDSDPSWSPDGKWIAFVSQDGRDREWYTNDYACVVPAAGGKPINLTRSHDESVMAYGGELRWGPNSDYVVFNSVQHTAAHLFRAHLDGAIEPVTSGPSMNGAMSWDAAARVLAFVRQDSEHPADVWVMRAGGAAERLTDVNPQTRELHAFPKRLVTWKGAKGLEIEGLVVYPLDYRAGRRVPLIVNVHGGPAGTHGITFTGASRVYPWVLFAQKGYAILLPNPRGSGGYGEHFRAANVRDWGGDDFLDIMAGVDTLIERGVADPNRLGVCGWSYGGFMTSTVVTKTERFKAACVGAGVTDLASMAGTCDIPEFNRSYFDAWPWDDPRFYVEHSAVFYAKLVTTPTLIFHGEADARVPTSQGWEFYNALKRCGVQTDLVLYPRTPHGPREPKLLRDLEKRHLDWMDRFVVGSTAGGHPAAARRAKP